MPTPSQPKTTRLPPLAAEPVSQEKDSAPQTSRKSSTSTTRQAAPTSSSNPSSSRQQQLVPQPPTTGGGPSSTVSASAVSTRRAVAAGSSATRHAPPAVTATGSPVPVGSASPTVSVPAEANVLPPAQRDVAGLEEAQAAFLDAFPEYAGTSRLDELRAREFHRLDEQGHCYLDYTGASLYGASQIHDHSTFLANGVFGNPHSTNPTSSVATAAVESARRAVREYFNADEESYEVVFTANASHALKLVGEGYPFDEDSHFALLSDNHNSVNGIREFARARGSKVSYVPLQDNLRADDAALRRILQDGCGTDSNGTPVTSAGSRRASFATPPTGAGRTRLFAFPGQSNFSGVKHPLSYIELAHSYGWDVLLDAAAYVPTNRLDLSIVQPDYVCMSFYKMFGYPTGVGALLIRKPEPMAKLRRPWFAGGTVNMVSVVANDLHQLHRNHEAFEDGTVNYLSIPAIEIGLRFLRHNAAPELLGLRVACLTAWTMDQLRGLKHRRNGAPVCRVFGPTDTRNRGGTIALAFYDSEGVRFHTSWVEQVANDRNISIRGGCFCNPGAGEKSLNLVSAEMVLSVIGVGKGEELPFTSRSDLLDKVNGGAERISFGIASNFTDAFRFIEMVKECIVDAQSNPPKCTKGACPR